MNHDPEKKPPQDLLDWLGLSSAPNWSVARPLGYVAGFIVVVLFMGAIVVAASVLLGTFRDVFWAANNSGPNLGAGALVTAVLGAPFLIWGTLIRHQSLRYQKEGHMTDRISKAVEMLGAEKKVDRIGRPVIVSKGNPDALEAGEQLESKTIIEWRGEVQYPEDGWWVAEKGAWQVFSETLPNLEVRIGAILSLERIAQDSTTHDKGRDHVRVMEILCAYVRENAPAISAQDHPYGEWEPLKDDPTDEEREAHQTRKQERFGGFMLNSLVYKWAQMLPPTREDIAIALKVIGRRIPAQVRVEAAWPDPPGQSTTHPADTPCPMLSDEPGEPPLSAEALEAFKSDLQVWRNAIANYAGYRLDLRRTNLQRADMAKGKFQCCRLDCARMEGADLGLARMEGANLQLARMEGAIAACAHMEGASLVEARMEVAFFAGASMQAANFAEARMEGTDLQSAHLEGADLRQARMEGATLWGARMEGATSLYAATFQELRGEMLT